VILIVSNINFSLKWITKTCGALILLPVCKKFGLLEYFLGNWSGPERFFDAVRKPNAIDPNSSNLASIELNNSNDLTSANFGQLRVDVDKRKMSRPSASPSNLLIFVI
jgi:hypothetical protein